MARRLVRYAPALGGALTLRALLGFYLGKEPLDLSRVIEPIVVNEA